MGDSCCYTKVLSMSSFGYFSFWLNERCLCYCQIKFAFIKIPGPSCSKLTTSLVNVSLKFQTLILQIHCYFLLKM